jgi:hypothetical protein
MKYTPISLLKNTCLLYLGSGASMFYGHVHSSIFVNYFLFFQIYMDKTWVCVNKDGEEEELPCDEPQDLNGGTNEHILDHSGIIVNYFIHSVHLLVDTDI